MGSSVPATNPFSTEPQSGAPVVPQKKPNNLLKIIIPVVALLVVGGIVFFVLNSKNSPATPNNTNNNSNSANNNSNNTNSNSNNNNSNNNSNSTNNNSGEFSKSWSSEYSDLSVNIDPKTGSFTASEHYEGETYTYRGTLPADALKTIMDIANRIDFDGAVGTDEPLRTYWFTAIYAFAGTAKDLDEEMYPCSESDNTEECDQFDTNRDGKLTRRELAYSALSELEELVNK